MLSVTSHRRLTAWLALAALALELVISFGHVHLGRIHHGNGTANIIAASVQAEQPPAQQPADDDDGYCAICATIYLTASSFVPQAPQLPARFASRPVEHFDRVAFVFIAGRRTPFRSRAPPLI